MAAKSTSEIEYNSAMNAAAMIDAAMIDAGVLSLLEAEPTRSSDNFFPVASTQPDIPALREQLAVLVLTGKAKESIGVQLTHKQVKHLSDKDVEKYTKRYQAYVGSKTTESLIDSVLFFFTKVVGMFVKVKDIDAYQKDLRNDYIINKELSDLAGNASLKGGRCVAVANAALITAKHIDFNELWESKNEANSEEIDEQSSPTAE